MQGSRVVKKCLGLYCFGNGLFIPKISLILIYCIWYQMKLQHKSYNLLFFVFIFLFSNTYAQDLLFENSERASFITDISRYVTWKNDNKIDIYRIGILDVDSIFFNDFKDISQNKTIQEKPIDIKLFNKIIDVKDVEILFLNRNTGFDIDLVYQQIKSKQILLLSENYPFHKSMINFIVVDGKKRFEINQARMEAEGFKTTVTFAALAVKSELDWHKIYTETEKELFDQKDKVAELNIFIEKQKGAIENQKKVLSGLMDEINIQKNRLLIYVEEVEKLEDDMAEQKIVNNQLLSEIRNKQNTLDAQENALKKMIKEISEKEAEDLRHEKILTKQTFAINEQDKKIEQQGKTLIKQIEKLHQQSIIINLGIALIIMFIVLVYFIYRSYKIKKQSIISLKEKNKIIKEQKELVEIEKEKSDVLLLNILPHKVAEDLKLKGFTEPEEFRNVSVFFSDFVGFTEISSHLPPKVIIEELNDLYTSFDNIMQINECERIKTIGDAYMAVCGMPILNADHAYNLAEAARQLIVFLEKRNQTSNIKWKIRVGIHSGKVVGGIVGTKKFIYDIFGDTINVAARMETNSLPMRINLSEYTYNLLKDKYHFEKREPIIVKGKGLTNMYFLEDNK